MYLSSRAPRPKGEAPSDQEDPLAVDLVEEEPEHDGRTGAEGNVVALGVTSMFTDVSSEMVASVLPIYLTVLYGFTPLQFGLFDGFYQGLAALMALGAAVLADRWRRLKEAAGIGYAVSTVATAGLVAAQGAWVGSVSFLYLDRLGKGVRTAPRDAIISLSVVPARLGRAFGLHRAFDTAGAVAGPVVASFVLARSLDGYGTVFAVAFCFSLVGLAALVFFVDGRRTALVERARRAEARVPAERPRRLARLRGDLAVLAGLRTYRLALLLGGALAFLSPGDGLLYLTFQRDASISNAQFPLLYFGGSVVFLVSSYPVGRLADRIGRWRVFLFGEALFAGAFLVLASGQRGPVALVLLVVLIGGRYAATDGVLMALASSTLPPALRATGLGVLVAVLALGHLFASTCFGALWGSYGGAHAAKLFGAGLLSITVAGAVAVRWRAPGRGATPRMEAR